MIDSKTILLHMSNWDVSMCAVRSNNYTKWNTISFNCYNYV